MPFYECVFIARQDISAEQVNALTDSIETTIKDQGGTVEKQEYWGLRSLAFKIKKNRKGHYVLLNVEAPTTAIHEMERQMRINEDVIRYLTIRVNALEEGPSIIMRSRSSDDRPRREYAKDESDPPVDDPKEVMTSDAIETDELLLTNGVNESDLEDAMGESELEGDQA